MIEFAFPKSVDINPTAACNLACEFCWGPDHKIKDGLNTDKWKSVIDFLSENGTRSITFTGGEPLLRKDIIQLLQYSKDKGMRITLSTNTILVPKLGEAVLPLIDEIGIPFDSSSKETNLAMRQGRINNFESQVYALENAKRINPNIHVTVRTVVSKVNKDELIPIGNMLSTVKDNFNRWKLYQFSPFSYGKANEEKYSVSDNQYDEIVKSLMHIFPDLTFMFQSKSMGVGRYVFIGPLGDVYGEGDGEYIYAGNFLRDDKEKLRERITNVFDLEKNIDHGVLSG